MKFRASEITGNAFISIRQYERFCSIILSPALNFSAQKRAFNKEICVCFNTKIRNPFVYEKRGGKGAGRGGGREKPIQHHSFAVRDGFSSQKILFSFSDCLEEGSLIRRVAY